MDNISETEIATGTMPKNRNNTSKSNGNQPTSRSARMSLREIRANNLAAELAKNPTTELTQTQGQMQGQTKDPEPGPSQEQNHVENSPMVDTTTTPYVERGTSDSILEFTVPLGMEPTLTDSMSVSFPRKDKEKVWAGHYVNL